MPQFFRLKFSYSFKSFYCAQYAAHKLTKILYKIVKRATRRTSSCEFMRNFKTAPYPSFKPRMLQQYFYKNIRLFAHCAVGFSNVIVALNYRRVLRQNTGIE